MIISTPKKYTHERIRTAHKRTFSDIEDTTRKTTDSTITIETEDVQEDVDNADNRRGTEDI